MSENVTSSFGLQDLELIQVKLDRASEAPGSQGTGTIQLKLEGHGSSFNRVTRVRVLLESESDEQIASVETAYHVGLTAQEPQSEDIAQEISELAFRLSFPYHRATISDLLSKSGVAGFTMPLISDETWPSVIADSLAMDEEASHSK